MRANKDKKLKYSAAKGQNSFIYPLNWDELVADSNDHYPSAQHCGFKPAEAPPTSTHSVGPHHTVEQLLTMPTKNVSNHRSFPFGGGLIHPIHGLGEFGLDETQV